MKSIALIILSITSIFLTSCAHAKKAADQCFLLDLQQKEGEKLIPLLNEFAEINGLNSDKSNQIIYRYYLGKTEDPKVEIIYRIGMGKFGAMLLLFSDGSSLSDNTVDLFNKFVDAKLTSGFAVRKCEDVPNFKIPVIYR